MLKKQQREIQAIYGDVVLPHLSFIRFMYRNNGNIVFTATFPTLSHYCKTYVCYAYLTQIVCFLTAFNVVLLTENMCTSKILY
jgi:hypothetical protein